MSLTKPFQNRVIVIGDSGVGKTSVIMRGINDTFDENTLPTVGAGVFNMELLVDGKECNFAIWDTAGQETFKCLVPLYFKDAACAIIMFSFDNIKSLMSIQSWIDLLIENSINKVPFVIVGNKFDIEEKMFDERHVNEQTKDKDYHIFFTSAKTGEKINDLFQFVARNYLSDRIKENDELPIEEKNKCC